MKTPTLIEQIGIAIALTMASYPATPLLHYWFSPEAAHNTLLGLLLLAYILCLCILAPARPGKIILISISAILTGLALFIVSSPLGLTTLAIGLLCTSRTLLFYRCLVALFSDALLQIGAISIALWAYSSNGSLLLSIWCFFLCQALWVFIPIDTKQTIKGWHSNETTDRFSHSHRMAETALAVLFRES